MRPRPCQRGGWHVAAAMPTRREALRFLFRTLAARAVVRDVGAKHALSRARRAILRGGYEDYNNLTFLQSHLRSPTQLPYCSTTEYKISSRPNHVLPSVLQYVFQDESLFWRFCILLPLPFHNSPLLPHLVYYL